LTPSDDEAEDESLSNALRRISDLEREKQELAAALERARAEGKGGLISY